MAYTLYILECSDGTYYTGITTDLARRLEEHQRGDNPRAYTFRRRPVKLAWAREFATYGEALRLERQIKGWSHAKKAALIRNDFEAIHEIVRQERRKREKEQQRMRRS